MNCAEYRDDIEANALGALDEPAASRLWAHVAQCDDCADLSAAYRIAVDHLALSAPLYKAPPRLKEVVLGGVGAFRPKITPGSLLSGSRWWAAAAAVFLAFAIGGLAWAVILSREVNDLRGQNDVLVALSDLDDGQRAVLLAMQGELNSTRTEQRRMSSTLDEQSTLINLALDPALIPTELQGTGSAAAASCRYVWSNARSMGALLCQGLPSLNFTLTYELWVTRSDRNISYGTFTPKTDGTAHLLVKTPPDVPGPTTNMWVTIEVGAAIHARPSSEVALEKAAVQQAQR